MKTKRSVLSALLAGAMVFSLAGCTPDASSPGTAAATAAPTAEGVPQGRWVESTVVIPQGLSLCGSMRCARTAPCSPLPRTTPARPCG